MAKLIVDLQKGLVEVEGDDKFIERVYGDIRQSLLSPLRTSVAQGDGIEDTSPGGSPKAEIKTVRRKSKAGGPSCASRIETLKDEDFFKEPKAPKDVISRLREKGTTYARNQVAASLTYLTKSGKLRRFDEGGWKYQNP